jgi:hypothetical protein
MDLSTYVQVRRDLLRLWEAKNSLHIAAQSRFPKSHPVFKAIEKLCVNDPTCVIRQQADNAACLCADKHGAELFRGEVVDGVRIPSVTHWFYGISGLLPKWQTHVEHLDRAKTFFMHDIELFNEFKDSTDAFARSVLFLPYVSHKIIQLEMAKYKRLIQEADVKLQKASPTYVSYLLLLRSLPIDIAKQIICACEPNRTTSRVSLIKNTSIRHKTS